MERILDFWYAYSATLAFGLVNSLFALSMYSVLSAGILSFTTVVFAAVGGFTAAQMMGTFGLPFWLAVIIAGVFGGLASAIIAAIFLKLETHWMALASLALILISRVVVLNTPSLTGGVMGMVVPVRASVLELAILLAIVSLVFFRLHKSWYGLAIRAVREDAAAASTMGVSSRQIQMIAFLISGVVGGLAGAALATTLQYISADTFYLGVAFTMIASTVLGGSFFWFGPIVGAFVFTALPTITQAILPEIQDIAKGVVLLVIMIYLPRGLIDPRARGLRKAARQRQQAAQVEFDIAHKQPRTTAGQAHD
ncbi:branched-chain amino acid ABC transporter permease [Hoeflea sp.]|uniref:branched-chain amino acid ABC transporter permease n=1 Tax=Hoeflea sp. TaxID=1940281 RepID=UPI0019CAF83F|nr:branched-chain amino acid ABC transporter permease [Hoeflea sp.]MBC7282186.1 branched-chain amino acid ABC transporter permease [Hoeflea sp.]